MSLSDPLGDMLTRIRNGQMRGKESVLMPASRFRGNVLDVLQREGYIKGFKKLEIANNKNEFKLNLNTLMVSQLLKVYQEFLHLEEGFTLRLMIYKETLMALVFLFYRHLKAFYLIVET